MLQDASAKTKTNNKFSLCYINKYPDEHAGIGIHQDKEERPSKFALVMVTTGATREFSIWKTETITAWKSAKEKDPTLKRPPAD